MKLGHAFCIELNYVREIYVKWSQKITYFIAKNIKALMGMPAIGTISIHIDHVQTGSCDYVLVITTRRPHVF